MKGKVGPKERALQKVTALQFCLEQLRPDMLRTEVGREVALAANVLAHELESIIKDSLRSESPRKVISRSSTASESVAPRPVRGKDAAVKD